MKGNKSNKKDVSSKEKRKPCNLCRWYEHEKEREFHRRVGPKDEQGQRTEIIEIRSVCRNPNAKAYQHLVHATQTKRECPQIELGKYEAPKKEEKKPEELKELEKMIKKTKTDTDDEKTSPDEYHGTSEATKKLNKSVSQWQKEIQKRNKEKSSIAKNKLNGETKLLTVKRGKVTVK